MTKLTAEHGEVIRAQNDAIALWPHDPEQRRRMIEDYKSKQEREKDAVKAAKDKAATEIGAKAAKDALVRERGWDPHALSFCNRLLDMPPANAARAARQVIEFSKEHNVVVPELFDATAFGTAQPEDGKPVFDSTGEGQRRGGASAEPRTVEEMAATHTPAPTPGLDLDEALRQLEAYKAANPPKRGPKNKELKRLEEQVESARSAAPEAEAEADFPELPEAGPDEISTSLRESNAAADEHLAGQVEERAEKPKRGRGKAKATEAAPAAEEGPSAPPESDEDDDGFPESPLPAGIGDQPSSFRIG